MLKSLRFSLLVATLFIFLAGNIDADQVAEIGFSHQRGFYETPFYVTLATETEDAVIYFSLDGSEPYQTTNRGINVGTVYTGPILIGRTTCLHTAAVKPGWTPTTTVAHTYLFLDDVIRQDFQATVNAGFPASWGNFSSPDYGMDRDIIGTFNARSQPNGDDRYNGVYAATIRDDLMSIPTMSISMDVDDMFGRDGIYSNPTQHGIAYERPACVEWICPDGTEGFQVNCGIRLQGGAFRNFSLTTKKSFRLLFKDIYGPTKLEFPLFGEDATDRFDTIVLRAGANDGYAWSSARYTEQYLRDEFGRSLQRATGHAGAHGIFVHLYINGIYWGLYNPCERPDHSFSADYYGGDKDDWDAIHDNSAANGDMTAWNQMIAKSQQAATSSRAYMELQGCYPDGTRNPAYPHLLDVTNYVDYLIVNLWGGNWDWPWKNWWAGRDRSDDSTGFKFYNWDYENTLGNNLDRSPLNKNALNNNFSQAGVPHQSLRQNAEYRLLFADRVHHFFFNGGILTPESLIRRYTNLAAGVERAIVAESARWGDQHHSTPLTLEDWYDRDGNYNDGRAGRDWILKYYLPRRSDIVLQQFRDAGLFPNVDAPAFRVNGSHQHGGRISTRDALSMTAPSGQIWYTLDSSDPRVPNAPSPSAGVSPAAIRYAGPITLPHNVHVKARVLSSGTWSALNEAVFAVGPVAESLRITEIMYHPQSGEGVPPSDRGQDARDTEEFIELTNIGTNTINLNLVRFTNGIDFTFPNLDLAPGQYAVVVQNRSAFEAQYGANVNVAGQYSGRLDNAGERIILEDTVGQTILDFSYNDAWRSLTDGEGFSLTIINPANPDLNSWGLKDSWRASTYIGGS
ncbi:MAG: hypothetical protein A2Z25_16295, partial [Planctomycetes bacterium RBG_16_55_9]